MPRDRGVWLTAATILGESRGIGIGEDDIDRALEAAAPYITLDAEAGMSTYRLAHQTFVEFFGAEVGRSRLHGELAAALIDANERGPTPWLAANLYETRYAVEHLTVAAEKGQWFGPVPPFLESGGWLLRGTRLLQIDTIVEVLTTALNRIAASGWPGGDLDRLDTVTPALVRSRTALARDATQVGPMLHARLHLEPDAVLAGLGRRVAVLAGEPWLEMVDGRLQWANELDTRYTDGGTVRALAAGVVDGDPLVAIGIDHRIDLWDPRTARPNPGMELGDLRATALALAELDGRPMVAVAAGGAGILKVLDLDGATRGPEIPLEAGAYVDAVAVGRVAGRPAVAARSVDGRLRVRGLDDGVPIPLAQGLANSGGRRNGGRFGVEQ